MTMQRFSSLTARWECSLSQSTLFSIKMVDCGAISFKIVLKYLIRLSHLTRVLFSRFISCTNEFRFDCLSVSCFSEPTLTNIVGDNGKLNLQKIFDQCGHNYPMDHRSVCVVLVSVLIWFVPCFFLVFCCFFESPLTFGRFQLWENIKDRFTISHIKYDVLQQQYFVFV